MKPLLALFVVLALIPASLALAKRPAPKDVAPVKAGAIVYHAPFEQMGCVEARNAEGKLIWRRQIYVIKFDPNLEKDVQDNFITTMEVDGPTMTVKNERGSQYKLNLDSLEVKVVAGALVEGG